MRPSPRRLVLVLACVAAGLVVAQPALASVGPQAAPVPSLDPRGTQAEWEKLVHRPVFRPLRDGGRLPAAPRGLLCPDGLAPPRDDARGERVAVRAVLHLGAAGRRGQDQAPTRSGAADPRPRAEHPRPRGDPLQRLAEVGREHRLVLVPGGGRGAQAHGGRGLRRGGRRHVGAERGLVRRPPGRRQRPREPPRAPARPLRRGAAKARRRAASCSSSGSASACRRSRRTRPARRSGSRTRRSGPT